MKHLKEFKIFEAKKAEEKKEDSKEFKDANADFFQSIIGEKIKCKKDYKYRKNSLTNIFAYVDDIMKIKDVEILIHPKDAGYVKDSSYKDLSKNLEAGATVEEFKINVKNLTKRKAGKDWWRSEYIPAIKTKKQFLTYFEIVK